MGNEDGRLRSLTIKEENGGVRLWVGSGAGAGAGGNQRERGTGGREEKNKRPGLPVNTRAA